MNNDLDIPYKAKDIRPNFWTIEKYQKYVSEVPTNFYACGLKAFEVIEDCTYIMAVQKAQITGLKKDNEELKNKINEFINNETI